MGGSSITTDCIELGNTISRASLVLNDFVREVREARADLDNVSRELHSLQSVLDLLMDDAGALPTRVATETPALLQQCNRLVSELDADLLALDGSALSRPQKRSQWISIGKGQIADLLPILEAHRTMLGLALDLVGVYVNPILILILILKELALLTQEQNAWSRTARQLGAGIQGQRPE